MEYIQNFLKNMFKLAEEDKLVWIALQVGLFLIIFISLYNLLLKSEKVNSDEYQSEDWSPNPQSPDSYHEARNYSTISYKRRSNDNLISQNSNSRQYPSTWANSESQGDIVKLQKWGYKHRDDVSQQKSRQQNQVHDMDKRMAIFLSNEGKFI